MMEQMEAIRRRHSVRQYKDKRIEGEVLSQLQGMIDVCNKKSGLHIQLCLNEPEAFDTRMAHYGKFRGVRNYIALVGKKNDAAWEACGYYGEKVVIKAQQLGLNTCWVALTYGKGKTAAVVGTGEKLHIVISVGYGETEGSPRKTKPIEELSKVEGTMPDWFRRGMEAVQLAPTAMNQQRFRFILQGDTVKAVALIGPQTKVDLGIAKAHFEMGAGPQGWRWAE